MKKQKIGLTLFWIGSFRDLAGPSGLARNGTGLMADHKRL
jgi:hypothetical protein